MPENGLPHDCRLTNCAGRFMSAQQGGGSRPFSTPFTYTALSGWKGRNGTGLALRGLSQSRTLRDIVAVSEETFRFHYHEYLGADVDGGSGLRGSHVRGGAVNSLWMMSSSNDRRTKYRNSHRSPTATVCSAR